MNSILSTLERLGRPRLLVLGDLILDRYTWGNAGRVSPEAPVLVLQADDEEIRTGGAASVASLARALEADVALAGIIGNDPEAQTLLRLLADESINTGLVFVDPDRPTTTKERFVGRAATRHAHQILRVDREIRSPIHAELERRLAAALIGRLDQYDAVLISDYAKGVCTPRLLAALIAAARDRNLPVLVDPARTTDYAYYQGATLLKPNRIEAELATGKPIRTPEEALSAGEGLCRKYSVGGVLVTLDRDGMALVLNDGTRTLHSVLPREIYDITGAGDITLAMLGVCLAAKTSIDEAVPLANTAAGIEVQRMGVAPVSRSELRRELLAELERIAANPEKKRPTSDSAQKLVTAQQAAALSRSYREQGKIVVFTNGCFDLLHAGHVTCLQEAAAFGDVLFVAINSDESVRRVKGPNRPVIGERDRAMVLAALGCVDHVLIFDDLTPHLLIEEILPEVLVKGGTTEQVEAADVVESYGGTVRTTGTLSGRSTTNIISSLTHPAASSAPNRGEAPVNTGCQTPSRQESSAFIQETPDLSRGPPEVSAMPLTPNF